MQESLPESAARPPRAFRTATLAAARRAAVCTLALLATTLPAQGQKGWSKEFDQPGLPSGVILAVSEYQGDLVAGGNGYFEADGKTFGLAARFDGTQWQPLGAGINGTGVTAFTEYQGELIAAGLFWKAGSTLLKNIARSNGTLWWDLGAGLDASVWALAVYKGELYAGGEFEQAGGQPAKCIARWDGTQWRPVGGGFDGPLDPMVLALSVGPDDRLYAAGEFTSAGGVTAHNIAVWDGTAWKPVGAGFKGPLNAQVSALEWYQGGLYAGSNFDLVPGGSDSEKIAVWDGTSWSAAAVITDHFLGAKVHSLQTFGTDLYAGGLFINVDGIPFEGAKRFARFDGTQWSYAGGIVDWSFSEAIYDMTVQGGKLVVGGEILLAGMDFAPGQAVVTNGVATFDGATWGGVGSGLGFDSSVEEAVLWNGDVVVTGGHFATAGSELVFGPAVFDGTHWEKLAAFGGNVVTAIVFEGDLVVAGEFTSVDGVPVSDVARFDGTQWTAIGMDPLCCGVSALGVYQGQLYAGGTGGAVRWNGTQWETFGPQTFGEIRTMTVHEQVLYMGGGMPGSGNLVSWDGSVQQIVGGGVDSSVTALESFEGDLVVGGYFANAGGVPANRLARWDGSSFTEFPGITGANVFSLTVFQGELHVGGNLGGKGFTTMLRRWDGSAWKPLGFGLDNLPLGLLSDDAGGHLYAMGTFRHAGGAPSFHFARWDTEPGVVGVPFCFGDGSGTGCPCGNDDLAGGVGCANSTGWGAELSGSGGTSVNLDALVLTGTGLPPNKFNVLFMGASSGAPLPMADGLRCIDGSLKRFFVNQSDGSGATVYTGVVSYANGKFPPGFQITAGSTWHFQDWYRDPAGPCGFGSNVTSALSVTFTP